MSVCSCTLAQPQVNFCFEVQFLLVVSWMDERIDKQCVGAGQGGQAIPGTDRRQEFWTPMMPPVFPNQVSVAGNPPIEVLEDLGFFTYLGNHRIACTYTTVADTCNSVVNKSMGYRMMRLRGSFDSALRKKQLQR